jgi:spore cortex formation protein SpoVR/YcgB (stage V sporulation)
MQSDAIAIGRKGAAPLFETGDWTFDRLARAYDAIEEIAREELRLDTYPNRIEVISSEQMLDAYASFGMPIMYRHWSFGKRFAREEHFYRKGLMNLAYEIVINSNPCISYLMEENTMAMQTLVMAHAGFGHNHFFKNNYAFRQWTDAAGILDFLEYAKNFVARCEERHGAGAVERVLDAAHALGDHGVFRFRRPPEPTPTERRRRERMRVEDEERSYNDVWRTVTPAREHKEERTLAAEERETKRKRELKLPEENLIYFIERYSPVLEEWQREILRIAREINQYFYPQKQTKVMNEGCACFVHHYVANALYDRGLLTEGAMLEILHQHSGVVAQPNFDDPGYFGINPYALGFAMMQDIRRICTEPTAEDREWFPSFAGNGDWCAVLRDAWANFRDESFIRQFLSPHLIRQLRLFVIFDEVNASELLVSDIHDERGYARIRDALANSYDLGASESDIHVVDADLAGDRHLRLRHNMRDGIPLHETDRQKVVNHIRGLWGFDVSLIGVDASGAEWFEVRSE